jgi:hypothetical protein
MTPLPMLKETKTTRTIRKKMKKTAVMMMKKMMMVLPNNPKHHNPLFKVTNLPIFTKQLSELTHHSSQKERKV